MSTGELAVGPRGTASVRAVVVALLAVALAGCGGDVERAEAGEAADAFTAAGTTDPAAGCERLAPRTVQSLEEDGKPCSQALVDAGLPAAGARRAVEVAGHSAQVRYAGDTVFLARFDDGWRVTAAGCERTSADDAVPYDCSVEGG
jgi:hypothetical protein